MAEFRLALGSTVDVATTSEVKDAVDGAITGLQGHLDRQLQAAQGERRTFRTLGASTSLTLTSGGISQMVLVPSTPSQGKLWIVRRITILGLDDHSTASNLLGAVYVGDPFNSTLTQCVIPGQIIPYFSTFGSHTFAVTSSDQLFISFVATGTVTNQIVTATASVEEVNEMNMEIQNA